MHDDVRVPCDGRYLTVPYLRLSLVLTFFSTNDRVHKLESAKLRKILDSVLFEPGAHLSLELLGIAPKEVRFRVSIARVLAYLFNSQAHSPTRRFQLRDASCWVPRSVCC